MSSRSDDIVVVPVETVEELWRCAGLLPGDPKTTVDYVLGAVFRGGGLIAAAIVGETTAGLIWGTRCQDPDTIYIPYIFVAPEARGQGLYSRLMARLFESGRQAGFRYAFGLADPDNAASNKGMLRSGFHLIHKGRKFYYPDAEGFFYFIDLVDPRNGDPPRDSSFWRTIMMLEPL